MRISEKNLGNDNGKYFFNFKSKLLFYQRESSLRDIQSKIEEEEKSEKSSENKSQIIWSDTDRVCANVFMATRLL